MLSALLSQLGGGPTPLVPQLADEKTQGKAISCIFCNVSAENGFKIAYEDEFFLAFEGTRPTSAVHCLVVPRRHINNIRTLRSADVQLLKDMERIGHTVLDKFGVPSNSRRMGFHIPPFYSIDHLHLHVQSLPHNSRIGAASFYISTPLFGDYSKGFSWFVEVNQAIRILARGGTVGVGPS